MTIILPRSCHVPALEEPEGNDAEHQGVSQQDEKGVQRTAGR